MSDDVFAQTGTAVPDVDAAPTRGIQAAARPGRSSKTSARPTTAKTADNCALRPRK